MTSEGYSNLSDLSDEGRLGIISAGAAAIIILIAGIIGGCYRRWLRDRWPLGRVFRTLSKRSLQTENLSYCESSGRSQCNYVSYPGFLSNPVTSCPPMRLGRVKGHHHHLQPLARRIDCSATSLPDTWQGVLPFSVKRSRPCTGEGFVAREEQQPSWPSLVPEKSHSGPQTSASELSRSHRLRAGRPSVWHQSSLGSSPTTAPRRTVGRGSSLVGGAARHPLQNGHRVVTSSTADGKDLGSFTPSVGRAYGCHRAPSSKRPSGLAPAWLGGVAPREPRAAEWQCGPPMPNQLPDRQYDRADLFQTIRLLRARNDMVRRLRLSRLKHVQKGVGFQRSHALRSPQVGAYDADSCARRFARTAAQSRLRPTIRRLADAAPNCASEPGQLESKLRWPSSHLQALSNGCHSMSDIMLVTGDVETRRRWTCSSVNSASSIGGRLYTSSWHQRNSAGRIVVVTNQNGGTPFELSKIKATMY